MTRRLLLGGLLATLSACSLLDWSGLETGGAPSRALDAGPADATSGSDASSLADAARDAGSRCDPAAPFETPVLVPGAVNTLNENELDGFFSADERTLYFARDHGDGNTYDILVATRSTDDGPFGEPVPVAGLATTALAESTPFLAPDGTMYLTIAGPSGRGRLASARPLGDGGFAAPVELDALDAVSAAVADPFLLGDGTFYFSDRYDEIPMVATATRGSFTAAHAVPGLPRPAYAPKATADDLSVYFGAPPRSGAEPDLYVARRASRDAGFDPPERLDALSTDGRDMLGWISADGCHVLVAHAGTSSMDLYVSARGH